MRVSKRIIAILTLCLLLLSLVPPVQASDLLFAQPTGRLALSRPPISTTIFLDDGAVMQKAHMWVDGQEVPADIEQEGSVVRFRYTPPEPLGVGKHQVRVAVEVAGAEPVGEAWEFEVIKGAVASVAAPDRVELEALARVNAYRYGMGAPSIAFHPGALGAARWHADYMAQTSHYSHQEDPASPYFLGTMVWNRTARFMYGNNGIYEALNSGDPPSLSIDKWIGSLYHRLPLVEPSAEHMGFGYAGGYSVLVVGSSDWSGRAVMFPYPGQTGVPTAWDGHEWPDPLALYPHASYPTGPVITLTLGMARRGSVTLESARLTDPHGNEIPVMTFSPTNDRQLSTTVAIIPYAPLRPGTTYTVRMTGKMNVAIGWDEKQIEPYDYAWSFTTTTDPEAYRYTAPALPGYDLVGHWSEPVVRKLLDAKIVSGYPDGRFAPDEGLTRAAFVKLVAAASGLAPLPGQDGGFADTSGHWSVAQGYLGAAVKAGIIVLGEYANRRFEPDRPITREEIAIMVVRAMGLEADAATRSAPAAKVVVGGRTFTDLRASGHPGHIMVAVEQGIVSGYSQPDGTFVFRPASPASRAEAAVMISRMLAKVKPAL